MLTLIYYQFQYSKKQWLATLPVLFVASIVGGTAVNGIISLSKYPSLANTDNGPSVVFNGLIIFGGLTLFLLVSGLIRFLMALFRKDYELWTILGTNRSQLSFLVGGQLFIVAFLFSLPGALLSTVTTQIFYNYLQTELGKELMPPMSISFDFFGVFVTIFIVSSIAAISGYRYTWKNLKKTSRQHFGFYLWRILGPLIVFSTWIGCIVFIFSPLSISENEAMTIKMSLVTMLLLLNLMIAQFISPYIQVFVI